MSAHEEKLHITMRQAKANKHSIARASVVCRHVVETLRKLQTKMFYILGARIVSRTCFRFNVCLVTGQREVLGFVMVCNRLYHLYITIFSHVHIDTFNVYKSC